MQLNYGDRKISWGNEALIFADMTAGVDGKPVFSNVELVTGLVSVGSMEDQAETNNYPADDVPDHGVKKGATLLQGEIVLIQIDDEVQDFLGREKTPNGIGYSYTGNFKTKAVQYLIKARKRDKNGNIVDGYRVIVYPQMTATAEPTFESETDSVDGVDPIQWTMAVQATASDVYTNNGYKVPVMEFELWGAQAKALEAQFEAGPFIVTPDSQIGVPAPAAPTNVTGQFETNGDVTLTFDAVPEAGSYVVHYGGANKTAEEDLTLMGYTEGTTWTLPAANVPALTTGDTIDLHVQAYREKGVGTTETQKAAYLHDGQFTGSTWSEPAVQLTKA